MEKFDMGKFLQEAGVNLDTGSRKQVVDISIDRIVPDPNNFYELSAIDDLAENIALFGLQQPIAVRPMPEDDTRYIIVSGHRRHAALKKLIEEDGRDDLREVMCIVDRCEENPKLNQLKLIYANASTRVLSSAEQAKQAEQVEKLLYELKEEGMEFPGRMRDHVAQACQMSTGKLARLKVIRDGLIPDFVPYWESEELAESTAYELARMPQDEQAIVFSVYCDKPKELYSGTVANIARQNQKARESIPANACPARDGCFACEEIDNRKKAAAKLKSWQLLICQKNTCCLDCQYLQSCTHPCAEAKGKQKEQRKVAKDAEKESARRVAEQWQPAVDAITESWKRMCSLAKDKGIDAKSVFTACRGWSCSSDCEDMQKYADGQKKFAFNDCMPGTLAYESAKKLIATADLLGCSIDYLLGRADTPTFAPAPASEPEKCVNLDTWHTGAPLEPDFYIGLIRYTEKGSLVPEKVEWRNGQWLLSGVPIDDADITVACWTESPNLLDSPLNGMCITGMSPSGHCGAAAYCDSDADCCLKCDERCSIRCGWPDAEETE